jgi:hypothetical protein
MSPGVCIAHTPAACNLAARVVGESPAEPEASSSVPRTPKLAPYCRRRETRSAENASLAASSAIQSRSPAPLPDDVPPLANVRRSQSLQMGWRTDSRYFQRSGPLVISCRTCPAPRFSNSKSFRQHTSPNRSRRKTPPKPGSIPNPKPKPQPNRSPSGTSSFTPPAASG